MPQNTLCSFHATFCTCLYCFKSNMRVFLIPFFQSASKPGSVCIQSSDCFPKSRVDRRYANFEGCQSAQFQLTDSIGSVGSPMDFVTKVTLGTGSFAASFFATLPPSFPNSLITFSETHCCSAPFVPSSCLHVRGPHSERD